MDYNRKNERIEHLNPEGAETRLLLDLSATGACCLHYREKDRGEVVTIRISDVDLRAKVMYCQHRESVYRLGLQFWNLSSSSARQVSDLVDKYSKGVPVDCEILEKDDDGTGED